MLTVRRTGTSLRLIHELEIYVDAGFTPAAATIVPAPLVMLGGKLLDAAALRSASAFSARPK